MTANGSGNEKKQWGVTQPLSLATPTAKDVIVNKKLIAALHEAGLFEPEEDARVRETVLGKLDSMLKEFVYKTSLKKALPESIASEAGGKIFTFGSYRLGVHGKGADIDTLVVVPKHVTREDFFADMYEALVARPEVTEITSVPGFQTLANPRCLCTCHKDGILIYSNRFGVCPVESTFRP